MTRPQLSAQRGVATRATPGLFPGRRTVPPMPRNGLTTGQSAEVARIQALYGRCLTWRLMSGLAAVALVADSPAPGAIPTVLVLSPSGAVVARQRATYKDSEKPHA